MNLYAARDLAKTLMTTHGLVGWTFRFDRARRRFGSCQPARRVITLSSSLTLLNDEAQVRDTILHEIAHAMAPRDGHGERWKAACRQIGANPKRCYTDEEVISPPRRLAPYSIGCETCDWWADRRKLMSRVLVCRRCGKAVIYKQKVTGRRFHIVAEAGRHRVDMLDGADHHQ